MSSFPSVLPGRIPRLSWCYTLKPEALAALAPGARLIDQVWSALKGLDATISPAPSDGVGEFAGDRIHLKWCAQSQGEFFTTEVVDTEQLGVWQVSVAPVKGIGHVAIARTVVNPSDPSAHCPALIDLWETVFSGLIQAQELHPKAEPHFMALVGAAISPNGLSSVRDDSVLLEQLRSDVDYWRDLSKKQAVLLKEGQHNGAKFEYVKPADAAVKEDSRQWRLDDLDEWAAIHSDEIVILPRAVAAAKRSHYENPSLVYKCLEILATTFSETKRGNLERDAMKRQLDELGVSIGGSVDPSVAGEKGEQYFVRWAGRRRFLDQHLGKGSARDERFTMRIYYTWDSEIEKVIVGWLPGHLETGRT